MPLPPTQQVRRNYLLNVGDGVLFSTGFAFMAPATILVQFVSTTTDSKLALGLITSVLMVGSNLPQILGAASIGRWTNFWASFRVVAMLPRVILLALCLVPWLPAPWSLWAFFAVFAGYAFTMGFNAPPYLTFISHVIASEKRGRFFGTRTALGGLFSLGSTLVAAWLLRSLPAPLNFSAAFAVASLFLFASGVCILFTRHDWTGVETRREEGLGFWSELTTVVWQNAAFRNYALCRLVISGSQMAIAFYAVFGMEQFRLDAGETGLLALALVNLPNMLGFVYGPLADRWGNKAVQVPVAVLAGVANLLIVVSPSLPVFVAALFLTGCANNVFYIFDSKWLLDLGEHQAGTLLGCFNLLLVPTTALLPLVAGVMAQSLGLPSVFEAAAACWLSGALMLAFMVREPRNKVVG
jgi:MFS family permease